MRPLEISLEKKGIELTIVPVSEIGILEPEK
jgi:hypothetical protein